MGRYSFTIPDDPRFVAESFSRAQVIGLEGIPWTSSSAIQHENLIVFRHVDMSGRLLIPFQSTHHGVVHLTTATLPESDTAYQVDLELARGSLSRLRNQVAIWQESGLNIPQNVLEAIEKLVLDYSSILFQSSPRVESGKSRYADVVDGVVDLMFKITHEFSQQVDAIGKADTSHVPVHCGVRTIATSEQKISIRSVQIAPRFESIESTTGMVDVSSTQSIVDWTGKVPGKGIAIAGPVIDFSDAELPIWLQGTSAFEHRLTLVKMICREIGQQYGKSLRLFNALAGISGVGHTFFNYPQQLQMSIEVLEVLDRTMPNTSTILGFDQPWGERLSMANGGVPAMEIAESLLRYGTRLSAIGLEFNLGYTPQGTFIRDPLQWVDLIDRWSQFGLPLVVYLAAPLVTDGELPTNRHVQTICHSCFRPEFVDYLATIIDLLKCRPSVNVVVWKYASDRDNWRFPLSGLVDQDGKSKPATARICELLRSGV